MPIKHSGSVPRETVSAGKGASRQVLIGPDEAPSFALRRFVIEPQGSIPPHTNTVEHEQYVLCGRARIGIGDDVVEVKSGDVLYIVGLPVAKPTIIPPLREGTSTFSAGRSRATATGRFPCGRSSTHAGLLSPTILP